MVGFYLEIVPKMRVPERRIVVDVEHARGWFFKEWYSYLTYKNEEFGRGRHKIHR